MLYPRAADRQLSAWSESDPGGAQEMAIADAMRERQEGEQELAQVQAALAEHRQRIGALKQDTEASLATAEKIEGAADAKERAVMEVRPAAPAPHPHTWPAACI